MGYSQLKSIYEDIQPIPEKTIPEYVLSKAKFYADEGKSHYLVDGTTGEVRLFSKVEEETRKIASAFNKLGLQKGDAVIFMIRDLCKFPLLLVGIWRANAILRASYPDDDEETISTRVKESRAKFIVCEEDALDTCKNVEASITEWKLNVITVNKSKNEDVPSLQQFLADDDGSSCPELQITEDDQAIIFCTSGTTGLPKGAIHTHKSFLFIIRSLERGPYLSHKPNLLATKATHISGMSPLYFLTRGRVTVVVSNLTKDHIFNAAEKYKVGFVFAFPTFLVAMAEAHGSVRDFSSIEVIFTAGVTVTPAMKEILRKLPNLKDIVVAYGMTESLICTSSSVLMENDGDKNGILGIRDLPDFSVGKASPGTELQIRNPSTMDVLGPNERGEICFKSPGIFQCYLNNPEATANAFIDGYFRTGDIGYFDENGFVYVVDRLKEIFKYYNNHISPTELESVIAKHPSVSEVCVVGIPDPGGHVPRAFVRLNVNLSNENSSIAKNIQEFANAQLASYKQLNGGVFILSELPKGKTGKISRQILETFDVSQL